MGPSKSIPQTASLYFCTGVTKIQMHRFRYIANNRLHSHALHAMWPNDMTTHPFNGPYPGLPRSADTRKVKTKLDFTEARDSEWQWHQPGHMQVCTSLQTDNHARTPPLSFLPARCPSCCPTNSIKALMKRNYHMLQTCEAAANTAWLLQLLTFVEQPLLSFRPYKDPALQSPQCCH